MATWHDYSSWSPIERAYVESKPDLLAAYDAGLIPYSPSGYFNDYKPDYTSGGALLSPYAGTSAPWWAYFEGDKLADFEAFGAEWEQGLIDSYNEMVEAGIPRSQLDPTPLDEIITPSDQDLMNQYLLEEEAAEQQRIADELEAERVAAEQAAINADIERIYELAGLRSQSETLATADVDEYIANASQYLTMRGVVPGFTDDVREDLITNRFTEYWSVENEQQLMDLAGKYVDGGYDLPTISDRVWSRGGQTITPINNIVQSNQTTNPVVDYPAVNSILLSSKEDEYLKSFLIGG